jgi:hypothetical protein
MTFSKFIVVRKILLTALLLFSFTQYSYASFISLDSATYGLNSITLDTDTGLEWIDPWRPIVQGRSSYGFNTYYDVLALLGVGGYFEGFRFATKQDLDTLFFSSAGFDSTTALSSSTATESDKIAAAGLISFFDTTWGVNNGPDDYQAILDGIYDSGIQGQPGSVYIDVAALGNKLYGGYITYYNQDPAKLISNSTPYGFWLIRDSTIKVPEPSYLIIFVAFFAFWMIRRETYSTKNNAVALES